MLINQIQSKRPGIAGKQRAQRNHFACCYHAWFSLKVIAKKLGKTLYQVKHDLWSDYLRNELRNPRILAYQPA